MIQKTTKSVKEAREIQKHAKEIGLNVEIQAFGTFVSKDDIPAWPNGKDVKKLGYKWATMELDRRNVKVKPDSGANDGYFQIKLSD